MRNASDLGEIGTQGKFLQKKMSQVYKRRSECSLLRTESTSINRA